MLELSVHRAEQLLCVHYIGRPSLEPTTTGTMGIPLMMSNGDVICRWVAVPGWPGLQSAVVKEINPSLVVSYYVHDARPFLAS